MDEQGVRATAHVTARPEPREEVMVPVLLNPADLSHPERLRAYDRMSVHPVPLVRNVVLSGNFLRAPDVVWLPAGMHFGMEAVG